ncbi:hypothetical protein niasHT_037474 [Heterodera trifolii]|uniref:Uncharacterized protein n=1 Tax=Heterodera trifolii TaxID=157864 RepID=A0ABD2INZ8_9BILA
MVTSFRRPTIMTSDNSNSNNTTTTTTTTTTWCNCATLWIWILIGGGRSGQKKGGGKQRKGRREDEAQKGTAGGGDDDQFLPQGMDTDGEEGPRQANGGGEEERTDTGGDREDTDQLRWGEAATTDGLGTERGALQLQKQKEAFPRQPLPVPKWDGGQLGRSIVPNRRNMPMTDFSSI